MHDSVKVGDIPYLKLVKFTYKYSLVVLETNAATAEDISGELYVPTFMDPEWVIMTYLQTYPLKNTDPKIVKTLVSVTLLGFEEDANGNLLPTDPSFYGEELCLAVEVDEEIDEEIVEAVEKAIDDRVIAEEYD